VPAHAEKADVHLAGYAAVRGPVVHEIGDLVECADSSLSLPLAPRVERL
jgi:hypothetical protein